MFTFRLHEVIKMEGGRKWEEDIKENCSSVSRLACRAVVRPSVCVCTCVCFQLIHTNKTSASSYTQQTLPPPASQTEPCCLQRKRQETGRSMCALQNKSALTGVWPGEVVWLNICFCLSMKAELTVRSAGLSLSHLDPQRKNIIEF